MAAINIRRKGKVRIWSDWAWKRACDNLALSARVYEDAVQQIEQGGIGLERSGAKEKKQGHNREEWEQNNPTAKRPAREK